uniref:Uncharacterized protein n=1 Tax=Chromera velia CCMP2878 TaxID=1169474 RepID=A0A0G4HN59_9ALVE|eukprot:Cvel_1176.t1-p1 / transcript=Cvel_1176.t1 / gene=Cvel_1176 / organism=Chromera_velia_CCMP2878 / gene_product=hypothetical protein / transcript_product=hypothetical protein / location=Cvel_scaffold39:53895-61382(-) / protein_length=992 / sequence_SO=supercontig / SO=protein_coding / is_pseudo=false
MSRNAATAKRSSAGGAHSEIAGKETAERKDNELCILFDHACPSAEAISELASDKDGFGSAWLLLEFIKKGRSKLPLGSLDLSGFSLGAGKLKLLLASIPPGPGILETLTCGSHVCKDACLPVLLDFLRGLKAGGTGGREPLICLKTLNLAKCDLNQSTRGVFDLLPSSLEHLDLSGNRLRCSSMEALGSVLSSAGLPHLLSLDLSDNPLGPSGLKAFAKCLSSPAQLLPLQSLRVARTKAKAEGIEALAEALKAKKTTSLQTLDLEGNEMRPAGVKHLASAVNAEAVPHLRVLVLKRNELANVTHHEKDYAPISELLTTNGLKELEELDLSQNRLFEFEAGVHLAVPGRSPKLRKLIMKMSSEQLARFATGLAVGGLPSLQELVIPYGRSTENLNAGGVVALANALSSGHLAELRGLEIAARPDMTKEAFEGFSRSLAAGKTSLLQTLDLSLNADNSGDGVGNLADGIRGGRLRSLVSIRLAASCITPPLWRGNSVRALGLALGGGGCPGLQKLDLAWREEGDEGVGGMAEGLGGGRLSSLRDLSLKVRCGEEGGGEGCKLLGEVLGTGKVPSLRAVSLTWWCNHSFFSLCEGLSGGRVDPPTLIDVGLRGDNLHFGLTCLAEVIRAGKLSGLRKFEYFYRAVLSRDGGAAFGEALTHAHASLASLKEIIFSRQTEEGLTGLLSGLSRGPGSLPALRSLHCTAFPAQSVQSLSTLVSAGRVPSLSELRVDLSGIGQEGMQAFATALGSSHVSALRRLDVVFGGIAPESAAVQVGMLSGALSSGHLRRLEELWVRGVRVVEEVRALCVGLGSGRLSSLHRLRLRGCRLGAEGGRALSEVVVAEKLPSLRTLDVKHTELTDGGMRALTEGWMSCPPSTLEDLDLSSNLLTGRVVDPLMTLLRGIARRLTDVTQTDLMYDYKAGLPKAVSDETGQIHPKPDTLPKLITEALKAEKRVTGGNRGNYWNYEQSNGEQKKNGEPVSIDLSALSRAKKQ